MAEGESPQNPKDRKLPSETLGPKPPGWLEKESDRIAEGRKEEFEKDMREAKPVPQTPAPEYADKYDQKGDEE